MIFFANDKEFYNNGAQYPRGRDTQYRRPCGGNSCCLYDIRAGAPRT